ncbi:uncharacterized protein TNCV_2165771 [Trichonephila clavipes]|nr:uncharacterized protein TNCV_2165771 [Trichonephila clavipes]
MDTARKILKRAVYRSRVTRRKPNISMINLIQRMAFAIEHFKKSLEIWRIVIFPDESKFCIFGIRVRKWAIRDSFTALGNEDLEPKIKDGYGGVMVPMTLHSPTENSLAVLNHKILEANSQVQNVKFGGHQTCLSINRLWHELCDMLRRLVGTTVPGHHDCSIQE